MAKTAIGHNSDQRTQKIQELVARYAKCDEESQALNDKRADIRKVAKEELDLDPKAFINEVNRAKQDLKKRDGHDESAQEVRDAIGQMNPQELWAHIFEREERKNKEREERKAAKLKEKAAEDKFKPAPDRKPKKGKSVGELQAQAYMDAHGNA